MPLNIAKGLLKLLMAKDLLEWAFATDLMGLLIAKDLLEFILTLALTELFTLTFCRGSGASFPTPQKVMLSPCCRTFVSVLSPTHPCHPYVTGTKKDGGLLPKMLICRRILLTRGAKWTLFPGCVIAL